MNARVIMTDNQTGDTKTGAEQGVAPRAFRDALSRFGSGVCVVTAVNSADKKVGLTVSSLTSVSLEPPLILFCVDKGTSEREAYTQGSTFAVNILAEDQLEISELFAGQEPEKVSKVSHRSNGNGCALLDGCLVNLECTREAVYDGGDHDIIVGRVVRTHTGETKKPLLHFRSRYMGIGSVL